MKKLKENKKKKRDKKVAFIAPLNPKSRRRIKIYRTKTIYHANKKLNDQLARHRSNQKPLQKQQPILNKKQKQAQSIAEELKRVSFDQDSNQVHQFQCWIQTYKQYEGHSQSIDYPIDCQQVMGRPSTRSRRRAEKRMKKVQ